MDFNKELLFYSESVNRCLSDYIGSIENVDGFLLDSMKYSLLSGGKRIRPIIFLAFNKMFGGKNDENAYRISCSVEMIHTYSLIHDDLPALDNDDMRRGKPSNHMVYGEDIAILAGDALLTQAFENIGSMQQVDGEKRIKMVEILAKAAGSSGMISGQASDVRDLKNKISDEKIIGIYANKTGKLFSASCQMGAVLAGADEEKIEVSGKIGEKIGVLFQLTDDILDVVGESKTIGKRVHSDINNSKCTFVSKNGIESAEGCVEKLSEEIKSYLAKMGCESEFLNRLVDYLKVRVS